MAILSQCYSVRGLNVMAGLNISNTINNLFSISYIALSSAVAIIVGQLLGAGKMEEAKDTAYKLIAFSVTLCSLLAVTLSRFTVLPVIAIYTMVQLGDSLKCILGFVLVRKGVWIQNIVE